MYTIQVNYKKTHYVDRCKMMKRWYKRLSRRFLFRKNF